MAATLSASTGSRLMKGIAQVAALVASAFSSLLSVSSVAAEDKHWTTWQNARFAFSICYPADVFPDTRESAQGHAVAMESDDSAQLFAAGIDYTAATLAEPIRLEKERLTHIALVGTGRDLTNGDTWFVVSGTRVDQVLYTKAIRSGGRLIAFRFRYPESLTTKYAPIVERISECLQASRNPH